MKNTSMTMIFQHKTDFYKTASGNIVPLILKVTTEVNENGMCVTINGKHNPLPFKKAIIEQSACDIRFWIERCGYSKIAEFYN